MISSAENQTKATRRLAEMADFFESPTFKAHNFVAPCPTRNFNKSLYKICNFLVPECGKTFKLCFCPAKLG